MVRNIILKQIAHRGMEPGHHTLYQKHQRFPWCIYTSWQLVYVTTINW